MTYTTFMINNFSYGDLSAFPYTLTSFTGKQRFYKDSATRAKVAKRYLRMFGG